MLTKRQIEIIKELNDKDKLTAQNLASSLHVSTKTIRNDIHAINAMYPNSIEAMQASGFKLTNNEIFALIKKTKLNSNNTDVEFLVLKHLMSRTSTYIDDLSDDLFISSTSLLKIIKKINNLLEKQDFNLSIIRRDNKLYLIGSEEEKRKAISFTISHEFTSNVLNINDYANFFQGLNLTLLKQKTIGYLNEKNIKMRDIELISFLLHVVIMIDRIKNKHNVVYDNYNNIDSYFIDLANGYLRLLQQISDVTFNDSEINYLATLFAGKVDINTSKNTDKIKMLIDFMLKDINEMYGIDFQSDEQLKDNLIAHLIGLQNRIKYNTFLMNPMIEDIKRRFPILFDISVYMADQIQSFYHVRLYEEEISYLTLHLMGSLERNGERESKNIVIISPVGKSGMQYFNRRLNHLHQYDVYIKSILSCFEYDKVQLYHPDLVISFDDSIKIKEYPIYYVKNLLNDEDVENIYNMLHQNHKGNKCSDFFEEELFFSKENFDSKEMVIHFLSDKLVERGYADKRFESLVLNREIVAPTAYGNLFAMPHPIKKEGFENKIAVCSLNKSINWDDKKVRLIFLICLNKDSQESCFDELFDRIVSILDNPEKAEALIKEDNYSKFLNLFFEY